jgi:hypothetical protein
MHGLRTDHARMSLLFYYICFFDMRVRNVNNKANTKYMRIVSFTFEINYYLIIFTRFSVSEGKIRCEGRRP